MGRRAQFPPKIHQRNGRDVIRIPLPGGREKFVTLGPSGSTQARAEYARIVAELGRQREVPEKPESLKVAELCAAHLDWSAARYEARQQARVRTALGPVVDLYGDRQAADFGPLALERVRAEYVRRGYCRRLCNQMVDCVRLAWRRAAAREEVSVAVADALYRLPNLHRGETVDGIEPHDMPRIEGVNLDVVERTLSFLGRVVADMVRLQLLTGARPGEICAMRPADIRRPWRNIESVEVWLFELDSHKSAWRGKHRAIPLGPSAQTLLAPYLDRPPEDYCFSPAESRLQWEAAKRLARKTRVQPSQVHRRKDAPKKSPGQRYTTQSYGRAIARACKPHGIPHWSPNQIRHAILERIETEYDQESARCAAGHTTPTTTAIYAQGVLRAAKVAAERG